MTLSLRRVSAGCSCPKSHIEAWTKWSLFCRHFQMHFAEWTIAYSESIFLRSLAWGSNWRRLFTGTDDTHGHWHFMITRRSKAYYRQTSSIRHTLVGTTIIDHSDVVGAAPVGAAPTQLHLHSELNIWLQWILQRHLQDEKRYILALEFDVTYIKGLTVDVI